jgi:hypothetical protein
MQSKRSTTGERDGRSADNDSSPKQFGFIPNAAGLNQDAKCQIPVKNHDTGMLCRANLFLFQRVCTHT